MRRLEYFADLTAILNTILDHRKCYFFKLSERLIGKCNILLVTLVLCLVFLSTENKNSEFPYFLHLNDL